MAFEPDIVASDTETQGFILVAEAKLAIRDLASTERQLKRYMAAMGCPVGLLITPRRLRIYRDRYLGSPEESIQQVGDFDVADIFKFELSGSSRNAHPAFQAIVQSWLESLATEAGLRRLPADLRRAAELYIVPAASQGTLRAAHPRVA